MSTSQPAALNSDSEDEDYVPPADAGRLTVGLDAARR